VSDDEIDSEELIASWRTTTSKDEEPKSSEPMVIDVPGNVSLACPNPQASIEVTTGPQNTLPSGALEQFVAGGVIWGQPQVIPFPEMSGIHPEALQELQLTPPAVPDVVEISGSGIISYIPAPSVTLSCMNDSFKLETSEGTGFIIHPDGRIEFLGGMTPQAAPELFWEHIRLNSPMNKIKELKDENDKLMERVKELEIKMGYRKADNAKENTNRFEEILDE